MRASGGSNNLATTGGGGGEGTVIASSGNGGVATSAADGGAISVQDINSGGNALIDETNVANLEDPELQTVRW